MSEVTMTCMTTKNKFQVVDPPVIMLANGRYAYRVQCPWKGKNDKDLYAFKFCSAEAYKLYQERRANDDPPSMRPQSPTVDPEPENSPEEGSEEEP